MGWPLKGPASTASSTWYTIVSPAATRCFFATAAPFTKTSPSSAARAATLRLGYSPRAAIRASRRCPASSAAAA